MGTKTEAKKLINKKKKNSNLNLIKECKISKILHIIVNAKVSRHQPFLLPNHNPLSNFTIKPKTKTKGGPNRNKMKT